MIDIERLAACALGELPPDDDAAVEAHVLACGTCAERFAALVRLGDAVATLVRTGGAVLVATRTLANRLDAEGLVSRHYRFGPGDIVACSVGIDDIYSLSTLHADLSGVTRLDVVSGPARHADVPFDAAAGTVYLLTASSFLRTLPTMQVPVRLIAVDPAGERTIATYTFDHTALHSPP